MKIKLEQATHRRGKNWIARITGKDPKYGLKREFIRATVIPPWAYYQISEDGVYEISEPRSLGATYRYFVLIAGKEKKKLNSEEIMEYVEKMRKETVISTIPIIEEKTSETTPIV